MANHEVHDYSHATGPEGSEAEDLQYESSTYDPNKGNKDKGPGLFGTRGRKFGAAGVAAVTAIAGGTFAASLMGSGHDTVHAKRPGVTAPAQPGEHGEVGKNSEVPSKAETQKWNASNIPLMFDTDGDGKMETYTGVDQAAAALEIPVKDFPKPKDATNELMRRISKSMLNWANNPTAQKYYGNYESHNSAVNDKLKELGFEKSTGAEAIGDDYLKEIVTKAFIEENLTTDPVDSTTEFVNNLDQLRGDAGLYNTLEKEIKKEGGTAAPYNLTLKAKDQEWPEPVVETDTKKGNMTLELSDNYEKSGIPQWEEANGLSTGSEDVFGSKAQSAPSGIDIEQVQGTTADGKVWKVTGINAPFDVTE